MKTIVLSANPTPNMNLAKINIDSADFDPHCGPGFWVTFYNPTNNIIDRITHKMTFDQWQDWTSESSEIADYKYIADSITEDLGITYTTMDYPLPPVPPTITTQPSSASVLIGAVANFSVGFQGDASFKFQWYKDTVAIQGQTNAILSIDSVSESDAGSYTVKVTNNGGSITSSAATLTVVVPVAPTITSQPQSATVEVGGSAYLYVQAEGTNPIVYVWSKDGEPLPMSMGNSFAIMNAQTSNEGIYSVKITNMIGSVTSNDVTVTVTTPVVPEPVIVDPVIVDPVTPEPAIPEPAAPEPATPDPATV